MSQLLTNKEKLQNALDILQTKATPSGGGINTSDATATTDEIFAGETAYGASGKITGTFTIEEELTTQATLLSDQDAKLSELAEILSNKATATPSLQDKAVTPTTTTQTVIADSGYDGLSKVTVNGDANLIAENIAEGVSIFGVEGSHSGGGNSDVEASLLTREITSYSNSTLTKLGSYALSGTKITSLNLPALTTIAAYTFYECTTLTNVTFPSLTVNPYNGFRQFKGLVKADLPVLTEIGANGFYQCTALTTLILRNSTVCIVSSSTVFSGSPIASGTGYIYVPSALVNSYKNATNWATYANQFRAIEDYPEICG